MSNNKQQTAVDSLKDFFKQYDLAHSSLDYYEFKIPMHIFDLKFQQAKEIEKQRIIDAHYEGQCDETEGYPLEIAEKYYEQTYGGGEQ
jgi:hypothetical protein